jgi:hypothetical protein
MYTAPFTVFCKGLGHCLHGYSYRGALRTPEHTYTHHRPLTYLPSSSCCSPSLPFRYLQKGKKCSNKEGRK